MMMASWLFAVKRLFKNALNEILELVSLLAGVDLEAAVEVGRDFKGRCRRWFGWSECHNLICSFR